MWKTCAIPRLLLLLLILPPYGRALLTFKVYTNSYMTTWSAALAFCRKHHTDLVTIRNEAENQRYDSTFGWIGLYRDDADSPWKWSAGGEKEDFSLWEAGEPNTQNNCVYRLHTGTWRTDHCDRPHSFACYDEPQILVKETKTWEEALDHCRSLRRADTINLASINWNHSYDLITISTQTDHENALYDAVQATTNEVWTGLRFLAGEWLWVSGQQVQYSISSCEGDRFCGVLEKSGVSPFGIRSCSERRNFLCYRKPSSSDM